MAIDPTRSNDDLVLGPKDTQEMHQMLTDSVRENKDQWLKITLCPCGRPSCDWVFLHLLNSTPSPDGDPMIAMPKNSFINFCRTVVDHEDNNPR